MSVQRYAPSVFDRRELPQQTYRANTVARHTALAHAYSALTESERFREVAAIERRGLRPDLAFAEQMDSEADRADRVAADIRSRFESEKEGWS